MLFQYGIAVSMFFSNTAWSYSKAESVSKSVDNSGSSILGTAVTGSVTGASIDGDSLFAGGILCFPKKTKTERSRSTCKVIVWSAGDTGYRLSSHTSQVSYQGGAYPGFCSIDSTPPWMGC